jgi:predicted nucleotidyltransferase
MASKLAELLFSDYRRKVLGLLLLHPDKQYHVREIARLTNTVAGTLHKELSRLADAEVLQKQSVGNQVLYSANRDSPVFEELAGILRKTSGVVDVLADFLAPLHDKIHVAFVFGSVAAGKETSGSDIDLMVVGGVAFSEVVESVYGAQEILGREVNPKIYDKKAWERLRKTNDAFIVEIMSKPKLFVFGTENELG